MAKRRPKARKSASPAQQQQRELAWLMYITAGYLSNLHHAQAVNAYTLPKHQLDMLQDMRDDAQKMYERLQVEMQMLE
jgi:hypothetical protein